MKNFRSKCIFAIIFIGTALIFLSLSYGTIHLFLYCLGKYIIGAKDTTAFGIIGSLIMLFVGMPLSLCGSIAVASVAVHKFTSKD